MPATPGDRALVESPAILFTSEHFKRQYLAAQNAGLDYLAGSILCLWYRAYPEDFEGDVETNETNEGRRGTGDLSGAGLTDWERNA